LTTNPPESIAILEDDAAVARNDNRDDISEKLAANIQSDAETAYHQTHGE
jgi:hypothetical protein